MAPRKQPVDERIAARSREEHGCLVWTDKMKDGKPFLKGVGNPARHPLNITDKRLQVRLDCPNTDPRCIKPIHQRVLVEVSRRYDDAPPPVWLDPRLATSEFSARDMMEIEENLELLRNNEITRDDLDGLPAHLKEEILRRAGLN